MITTRKLKLAIVSDNKNEAYSFIRNEIRNQSRALNVAYSHLYFEYIAQEKIKHNDKEYHEQKAKYQESASKKYQEYLELKEKAKEDKTLQAKVDKAREAYNKAQEKVYKVEKDYNKKSREIYQQAVGLPKQTRLRKLLKREFSLHYDTEDRIGATVISDFSTDMKAGVLNGKRSLRNYKESNPLMIRARSMKLYEDNGDYFIKWIKDITFKIILKVGSKQKQNIGELKSVLGQMITGTYKMCDSSIQIG